MKNSLYFCLITVLILQGCFRLDDNLFNNNNTIERYYLDDYTGEVDFRLEEKYQIPEDRIHLLSLESQLPEEAKPTKIYALYIGEIDRIAHDTVIVYCHGNRDHMDFYWPRAKLLANAGGKNRFGVMMMDYRGFGLSHGKPTEKALRADVDAALKWLKDQGLDDQRTIFYGFSLGSAPSTYMAGNHQEFTLKPQKLILENPFASTDVMVQDAALLAMPASFFTNYKVDNAEQIKKVNQPLLWFHGKEDHFLNIKTHGELVFKNHQGEKKIARRVEKADHGDLPLVMGFETYLDAIEAFIKDQQ
jgi:fermentation-respiration switch protein FrsA (DUF1100 family)